jgi:hypothetical protein
MSTNQEIGEIRIKVPQNWIAALEEIHEKLGWDFEKECESWLIPGMQTNMHELDKKVLNRILQKHNARAILKYEGISSEVVKPENMKVPTMMKIVVFGVDQMRDMDYGNLIEELSVGARKVFPSVPCDVEGWGYSRYNLLRAVSEEIYRQVEIERIPDIPPQLSCKESSAPITP